jgi:Rps23 Pro-64 3,4-dihydroxylase Tpa1-like proline 4-hydroxylase
MTTYLTNLANVQLQEVPYQWAYSEELFKDNSHHELTRTFPTDNYKLLHTIRDDKSYMMYHRTIYDNRISPTISLQGLNPVWIDFINELLSKEYISQLSSCLKQNLLQYNIELNFWQYKNGGWLSPHTDKPAKIVSQLFYFNSEWDSNWGGSFRVLNSDNIDDYHREIFPGNGNSIILIRNDRSWHAVTAQTSPNHISRNVLQLIFWNHTKSTFEENY